MRRGMTNYLEFRIVGMDLSTCTDLTLYIRQRDTTGGYNVYTYTGTYSSSDHELMDVTIPKSAAVNMMGMPAEFQVAITDANGIPRSHEPIVACIGELLKESGYGS